MLKNLSTRSTEPELMDDFKGDVNALKIVFDDINNVNRLLGGNGITIKAISELIKEFPKESYTIVDMGCGDGTMLRKVATFFRNRKMEVRCIGIDLNVDALKIAEKESKDFPEIQYLNRDILSFQPEDISCDILLCTLTTHHFTDKDIPVFLKQFVKLTSVGVVINDLQRSVLAYYLFKLFSVIFIKTKTAKIDGLISISKGFVKSDFQAYSKEIPDRKHQIKWKWAFRYAWIMKVNR